MSDAAEARAEHVPAHAEHIPAHPSTAVYVIVAGFLIVLTVMELTVFYVPSLGPVLVPVLLILAAAKFALVAMFYMHLKYDGSMLSAFFVFPLFIATVLLAAMLMLFAYLSRHPGI